jgi:histidinol-phosphate phosphatase family protein
MDHRKLPNLGCFGSMIYRSKNLAPTKPFVIFDRDGTLIDHVHHLVDPNQVKLKEGLVECLQILKSDGFRFGIVSNQSVVARGIGSISDVQQVNDMIANGIKRFDLDFIFTYICPHLPDSGCTCRKPEISLGLRAIEEHGLDPNLSYMVGDQESDMLFGKKLGCKTVQLQNTGGVSPFADYYSGSLKNAAEWILADRARLEN